MAKGKRASGHAHCLREDEVPSTDSRITAISWAFASLWGMVTVYR